MIDALVKFGVKDQNVVLSTIEKIKKGKKDLAKKATVSFAEIKAGQSSKAAASTGASKEKQLAEKQLLADKKEVTATERFTKAAGIAGSTLMGVARAAASLDPVAFIQGTLSAAGKAATAIPFLGNVAQGALELAGISVGAAGGAVGSAKQSTPAALELEKRNAQSNLYGGELGFSAAEQRRKAAVFEQNRTALANAEAFDTRQNTPPAWFPQFAAGMQARGYNEAQTRRSIGLGTSNTAGELRQRLEAQALASDTSDRGSGWTPNDKAQFIQTVAGAFGKIQKPLAETLNALIAQGKNVEQFTQVAAGNWQALGTDEGAILQSITNSFSGALPSVKQSLQNELLKQYGGSIQNEEAGSALANRRANAATWARAEEVQTQRVADAAARMATTLISLDASLKAVELRLINGAGRLADAVNTAVNTIM